MTQPSQAGREPQAAKNTDREIWRGKSRAEWGDPDRFYADSLFVPQGDVESLGIDCGGYVIVKPIREWHALAHAGQPAPSLLDTDKLREALDNKGFCGNDIEDILACVAALGHSPNTVKLTEFDKTLYGVDAEKVVASQAGEQPTHEQKK